MNQISPQKRKPTVLGKKKGITNEGAETIEVKEAIYQKNRIKTWICKRDNKTIAKFEMLNFNSFFIWKQQCDHIIYSNYFGQTFDSENPYSQTQYFKEKHMLSNRIYPPTKKGSLHPKHCQVTFKKYLKQLYVMYLQTQIRSHSIFYYDTLETNYQMNNDCNWILDNGEQLSNWLIEHPQNSAVIIFLDMKVINQNYKDRIRLYFVESLESQQKIKNDHKYVEFVLQKQIKTVPQKMEQQHISVLQNQMIILFHKLLQQQNLKQLITGNQYLKNVLKVLRNDENKRLINQTVSSIRDWSFSRQYPYQKFYYENVENTQTNNMIKKEGERQFSKKRKDQQVLELKVGKITQNIKINIEPATKQSQENAKHLYQASWKMQPQNKQSQENAKHLYQACCKMQPQN